MRVALYTKVRADRVKEYEAAHREVPVELTGAEDEPGAPWREAREAMTSVTDAHGPELDPDRRRHDP